MRVAVVLVQVLGLVTLTMSHVPQGRADDFATRCAQPGVVKCVSFDSDADFNKGNGGAEGAWGARSGIFPPYGTSDYTKATLDTSVKASGTGSLKFTIPSNSGSDSSGAWFTNFTDDLSFQVGEGQEVYVQWRQRFSSVYLNTIFLDGSGSPAGGWKLANVSAGDTPTYTLANATSSICPTSCWDFEVVIQNTDQTRIPQTYANCAGPWPYTPMLGNTTNFTVQNVVECLYPDYAEPPCVKMRADEWMTFQVHIKVQQWDTWTNTIQLWVAREGQPSVMVIDCSPTNVNNCTNAVDNSANTGWYLHNSNKTYKLGKVWLLPYHTNKSSNQTHPTAYTWYDDLIISKTKIADPTPGVRPNPPTNVSAR